MLPFNSSSFLNILFNVTWWSIVNYLANIRTVHSYTECNCGHNLTNCWLGTKKMNNCILDSLLSTTHIHIYETKSWQVRQTRWKCKSQGRYKKLLSSHYDSYSILWLGDIGGLLLLIFSYRFKGFFKGQELCNCIGYVSLGGQFCYYCIIFNS